MNLLSILPSLRSGLGLCLLAAAALFPSACASKKGEAGLVVSTVDPAVAANAGQVDMTTAEPDADYSVAGIRDYVEDQLEPYAEQLEPMLDRAADEEEAGQPEISSTIAELKDYTVKKGDSLWSISREFGTSIDALKRVNGMSGDALVAGKALRIPGSGGSDGEAESPAPEDSQEVKVTRPQAGEDAVADDAEEKLPETLPSGVVPPTPPRAPVSPGGVDSAPVKESETTIGEDGFLRFGDE